jgi:hypothetical protein
LSLGFSASVISGCLFYGKSVNYLF